MVRHCNSAKRSLQAICCVLLFQSCLDLREKKSFYKLQNVGQELDLKILNFNILTTIDVVAINSGYPIWAKRKKHVFDLIWKQNADLVALQEVSPSQLDQIKAEFLDHYYVHAHKPYTPDAVILFDRSLFQMLEKGYWMLNDQAKLRPRRIAVWVKLKHLDSERELMFVSVHVDANFWKIDQIELLARKLRPIMEWNAPLFVAGDFNSDSTSNAYSVMTKYNWIDSYLGNKNKQIGTYPYKSPTRRIDHVFYFGAGIKATSWDTLDGSIDISDHKPVLVNFEIEAATSGEKN